MCGFVSSSRSCGRQARPSFPSYQPWSPAMVVGLPLPRMRSTIPTMGGEGPGLAWDQGWHLPAARLAQRTQRRPSNLSVANESAISPLYRPHMHSPHTAPLTTERVRGCARYVIAAVKYERHACARELPCEFHGEFTVENAVLPHQAHHCAMLDICTTWNDMCV